MNTDQRTDAQNTQRINIFGFLLLTLASCNFRQDNMSNVRTCP